MSWFSVVEGVIVGAFGGGGAGACIWLLNLWREKRIEQRDKERVFTWLWNKAGHSSEHKFRSTRTIASHTNLTEDRACYICSTDERIAWSTGERKDLWGLKNFGVNYGILFTSWGVGGFVMSRVSQVLMSKTGSYESSFIAAGLLRIAGIIMTILIKNKKGEARKKVQRPDKATATGVVPVLRYNK